ncbi:MAG TPA: hypothetical protein VIM33_16865 [Gaiellaceae bacterium]|jgi:hypothetical protein
MSAKSGVIPALSRNGKACGVRRLGFACQFTRSLAATEFMHPTRWHEQWQPHHYTFLYFHDEAVSFAAGHRPCAECRRDSYNAYRAAWADGLGVEVPSARHMNQQLHDERIVRGTHRRRIHPLPWAELPDGTFALLDTSPAIVIGDQLTEWTNEGYGTRRARPVHGTADVITPPSTVAALCAGYLVQINDAARERADKATGLRKGTTFAVTPRLRVRTWSNRENR